MISDVSENRNQRCDHSHKANQHVEASEKGRKDNGGRNIDRRIEQRDFESRRDNEKDRNPKSDAGKLKSYAGICAFWRRVVALGG